MSDIDCNKATQRLIQAKVAKLCDLKRVLVCLENGGGITTTLKENDTTFFRKAEYSVLIDLVIEDYKELIRSDDHSMKTY